MITCNTNKVLESENWKDNSIYILADFDKTITSADSIGSWDILSNKDLMPKKYIFESKELFNYYRPIELNEKMDFDKKNKIMIDWWNEEIKLFIKYKLDENIVNKASMNVDLMAFRKGGKSFFDKMHDRNIPVIIISAGIGNFIEKFLIYNNCYYSNVFIVSNFLKFHNGIAVGFSGELIHSLNKNIVSLTNNIRESIDLRDNVILLGDSISDIKMVKNDNKARSLKIGFLEEKVKDNINYFNNSFDVVCTNNTSFDELSNKVKILKR